MSSEIFVDLGSFDYGAVPKGATVAKADTPFVELGRHDYSIGLQKEGLEIGEKIERQTEIPQPGTWEEIKDVFTGKLRGREETADLPEVSLDFEAYKDDFMGSVKATAGLLMAADDEGRKEVLKKRFPNAKIETDEKGNDIVTLKSGEKAILNRPGISANDLYQIAFDTAWFAGPMKLVSGAKTALGKAVAGGLGAAAAEKTRQETSAALGTEEQPSAKRVAMAGLMGAAAEYIPATFKARALKKAEKRLGVEAGQATKTPQVVKRAEEIEESVGLETLRAQKTGSLKDLERQSKLAMEFEVGQEALRAQNQNATRSVTRFLKTVSTAKNQKGSAKRVKEAAQKAIDDLNEVRNKAAAPYYKKALKDTKFHSITQTRDFIRKELKDLPKDDPYRKALLAIKENLKPRAAGGGKVERGLRMTQLDKAYKGIGKRITRAWKDGDDTLVRELTGVRETLGKEIDTFNSFYKQGREAYKKLSPKINELTDSIVGDVARIKDRNLQQIRSKLFGKELFEADPGTIQKARMEISKIDPDAWDGFVRSEFANRIRTKMAATPGEAGFSVKNKPGQLYRAIFGTGGKDRSVLYSALNTEQRKRLRYIEEGLLRQAAGRPGGSQTQIRQVIETEFGDTAASKLASFLTPVTTAKEAVQRASIERNKEAAVKLIFDPKWDGYWKDLLKVSPKSRTSGTKMQRMLQAALKDTPKAAITSQAPDVAEEIETRIKD
jgi:hypothetical protein